MKWERILRQIALAAVFFLSVNLVDAARLPGMAGLRAYLAFAFTTDWDYRGALAQAKVLTSFTDRLSLPSGERLSAEPETDAGHTSDLPAATVSPGGESSPGAEGAPSVAEVRQEPLSRLGGETVTAPRDKPTWPLSGPVVEGFGPRRHPVLRIIGAHDGIDIGVPVGTPIAAILGGRVKSATRNARGGRILEVDHGAGLTSFYAHLDTIGVRVGQDVNKGEIIATSGRTGLVTGPHLHFEVRRDGKAFDPGRLLPAR